MSARALSLTDHTPAPSHADGRPVAVTRGELRNLRALALHLRDLAEYNDASEPGYEPSDVVASRELVAQLHDLLTR